jgi:hypothetical protein
MRSAHAALAAALAVTVPLGNDGLPDGMLGVWTPIQTDESPQAILGPMASGYPPFTAGKDPATGDTWMSLLPGQLFRESGRNMQYCFSEYAFGVPLSTSEQAPFFVNSSTDTQVVFCYRDAPGVAHHGMATHKKDCVGCDCARITITQHAADTLEFLFEMSPPVHHAHFILNRTAPPPPFSTYAKTLAGAACSFENHTGPLQPASNQSLLDFPDRFATPQEEEPEPRRRYPGCAMAHAALAAGTAPVDAAPATCKYPKDPKCTVCCHPPNATATGCLNCVSVATHQPSFATPRFVSRGVVGRAGELRSQEDWRSLCQVLVRWVFARLRQMLGPSSVYWTGVPATQRRQPPRRPNSRSRRQAAVCRAGWRVLALRHQV